MLRLLSAEQQASTLQPAVCDAAGQRTFSRATAGPPASSTAKFVGRQLQVELEPRAASGTVAPHGTAAAAWPHLRRRRRCPAALWPSRQPDGPPTAAAEPPSRACGQPRWACLQAGRPQSSGEPAPELPWTWPWLLCAGTGGDQRAMGGWECLWWPMLALPPHSRPMPRLARPVAMLDRITHWL